MYQQHIQVSVFSIHVRIVFIVIRNVIAANISFSIFKPKNNSYSNEWYIV